MEIKAWKLNSGKINQKVDGTFFILFLASRLRDAITFYSFWLGKTVANVFFYVCKGLWQRPSV